MHIHTWVHTQTHTRTHTHMHTLGLRMLGKHSTTGLFCSLETWSHVTRVGFELQIRLRNSDLEFRMFLSPSWMCSDYRHAPPRPPVLCDAGIKLRALYMHGKNFFLQSLVILSSLTPAALVTNVYVPSWALVCFCCYYLTLFICGCVAVYSFFGFILF